MDKLRKALSGEDQLSNQEEESNILGQFSGSLSKKTRITGFLILFVVGIFCSLLASFCLLFGLGMTGFAIFYTVGNIVSIGSTCFLMGPLNQLKKMFAPNRAIATILVIVMFFLTFFAAFVYSFLVLAIPYKLHKVRKAILVILFVVLQSLAMTWYSLSYIPYARNMAKLMVVSCVG